MQPVPYCSLQPSRISTIGVELRAACQHARVDRVTSDTV